MSDGPFVKTKIFISWSGERSKALAIALRDFIGDVLQNVEPFVSDMDIAAGQRWLQRLDEELKATRHGILCLTRDNLHSPWIHYEAGALAKSFDKNERVCACLLDMEPTDVGWPLAQFQLKKSDKLGVKEILDSINSVCEYNALPPPRLERQFERCWSELESTIKAIPAIKPDAEKPENTQEPVRTDRELLEEILTSIRQSRSKPRPKLKAIEPFTWTTFLKAFETGDESPEHFSIVFDGDVDLAGFSEFARSVQKLGVVVTPPREMRVADKRAWGIDVTRSANVTVNDIVLLAMQQKLKVLSYGVKSVWE